jgi:hypothetical protein
MLQILTACISVPLKECYTKKSFSHTILYYSAVLLIVLHETVFYPVFQKYLPQIESLQKVLIGMLLQITTALVLNYLYTCSHTSTYKHRTTPLPTYLCIQ